MINTQQYYTPTGSFDPLKLLLAFLLLLPLWLISFLYAGLLHWNPVTCLSPVILFAYCLIVSQLIINGINISNTQNRSVALFLGFVFAFGALLFSWTNFLAIWSDSTPFSLLEPAYLWEMLTKYYNEGAYSTFGIQIDGVFGAIIWIIEAIVIFFITILIAKDDIFEEVYCTSCDRWINPIKEFYTFTYADENKLIKKFQSAEFDFLAECEEKSEDALAYYHIDASCCNTCSKSYYLSLQKVTVEQNAEKEGEVSLENTTLVRLLKVNQHNFRQLYAKSLHWFHFTESGKYSPFVWLGLPMMAVVVFLIGAIYQMICVNFQNYYVTGMVLLGYSFVLYFATNLILQMFSVRNKVVSAFLGVIFGSLAVYITHTVLVPYDIFNLIRWHPNSIWLLLRANLENHGFTSMAWTGLIIESIVLFLMPMLGALNISHSRVYCEHCDKWAEEEDDIYLFDYPDVEVLKGKFTKQDLSFLTESTPINGESFHYFKLNAEWCKQCDTTHTLSLVSVEKKINSEGRVDLSDDIIYEDVIYTHDAFHAVMDHAKKISDDTEPVSA